MSVKNLNNFYRAWYEVELVRCLFLCVKKARLFLADFKRRYLIKQNKIVIALDSAISFQFP